MVAIYVAFVLLQVPLYLSMGKAPLEFDFKMQAAESGLRNGLPNGEQRKQIEDLLDSAEGYLNQMDDHTSRRALLTHERGMLVWKQGRSNEAIELLEKSKKEFESTHGPDSFHARAVDLRIGELEFLRGEYAKALVCFQRSVGPVGEYMGNRSPFVVRMKFREVSSLVALGRDGEAATLAKDSLEDLRAAAPRQDLPFLDRTAMGLDMLSLKGLISSPPGGQLSWKPVLTVDHNQESEHEESGN